MDFDFYYLYSDGGEDTWANMSAHRPRIRAGSLRSLAERRMMNRITQLAAVLMLGLVVGCKTHQAGLVSFLGIPEQQSSDTGPVGLINGQPCQIKNVSAVTETTFQEYQKVKQEGRIFAEETHGESVYYAVKENRDVRFDNASAWVEVIERFKTRKP